MSLTVSPLWLLLFAVPALLAGEYVQRRATIFSRFSVPAPVVAGLAVSLAALLLAMTGLLKLDFVTKVAWPAWNWIVTPGIEWGGGEKKNLTLPLLVGFFTCVGLNATWRLVRGGSGGLLVFWAVASVLAVLQNVVGVALARLLGESPLLGVVCGSLTLTGGHGTALGFASTFVQAGFPAAATVGAAAATFGVVCGSLIGGPVATSLIKAKGLKPQAQAGAVLEERSAEGGWLRLARDFAGRGGSAALHALALLVVIKLGAGVSHAMQSAGLVFPAYMGALLVGLVVRNVCDLAGWNWINSETVDIIGSLLLGVFLTITMASLNLAELAGSAAPMLVILIVQVALVAVFARWIVFRVMGNNYDAAIMSAGLCGFAMGATSNAVANMEALTRRFGPSPRAFLIVPTVGGLLVDLVNSFNITFFLNFLK